MSGPAAPSLSVVHVMRTYGAHGGEQQLSQYFGAEPAGGVRETFAFLYHDPVCSRLFAERAPGLEQVALLSRDLPTTGAWRELATLLPRLPLLQARFLGLIRRRRPAVCMVHGFQAALVAWPAAVLCRGTAWGYVHRITKAKSGVGAVFRLLYAPFRAVCGNSRAVTDSLAPYTSAERLVTLDNGLDWRRFETRAAAAPAAVLPAAEGPVIVSVGRLLPHKGQAMLVDAFAGIAGRHPAASLWIVGDGSEAAALRAHVAARGLENRVHLLGRREDVPAVLARATIFANASSWEGMSNAVLEGMAAGLPSVVADAPGVTECHADGVTGLVVRRDVEALAAGLDRLLSDADLRARMGAAAREHVRTRYSMEANRQRYLDLFDQLAGRRACAAS